MNKNVLVTKIIPTIIVIATIIAVGLLVISFFEKPEEYVNNNGILLSLESNSGETYIDGNNKEVIISGQNYGTITCESTNYDFAKCFVANSKLVIIPGEKVGEATITITESNEGKTAQYTVKNQIQDENTILLELDSIKGSAYENSSSLTITISGKNYGDLTCTTSNKSVATCSISKTTLKVTPKSKGTATITVKESKEGKTVDYSITVNKKTTGSTVSTSNTTLSLSATSGTTSVDGEKLTATISGKNYGDLSCSSNKTSIATCEVNGTTLTITPKAAGSATITVKESKSGKTVKYTATIQKVAFALDEKEGIASIGGNVLTTKIIANSYDKLSCKSSDTTIATCSINDNILIVFPKSKVGSATITVTDANDKKDAYYSITVQKDPVTSLNLTKKEGTTYLDSENLVSQILGTNYGKLSCVSSNTSIATCSISGTTLTIKPNKNAGTAIITVRESNTNKTINYTATIKKYVTLSLSNYSGTTTINGQVLSVSITANSYDKLSCISGDTTIATCSINENTLLVFPKSKEGNTTITVKDDNEKKEVSYNIKVQTNPVVTLYLSKESDSVYIDGGSLTNTILGSNYGELSCTSSNNNIARCYISGNKLIVTPTSYAGEVYIWVSESNEQKTVSYKVVVESHPTLSLSKTSGNMAVGGKTDYVIINATNVGELSCVSSDYNVANCNVSGSLLYITSGSKEGTAVITVRESKENKTVNYTVTTYPRDYMNYSCSQGKLQKHDTLGYICVVDAKTKTTQKYECLADIYSWKCPEEVTNCRGNALVKTYDACIASGCEVVSISHPETGPMTEFTPDRFFQTYKGTCTELEPVINYSCDTGFEKYGSGENTICYKKAN